MTPELTKKAIATNIETLSQLLADAATLASEALAAIQQGEENQAIGTILGMDSTLENALALYRVAVMLHRNGGAR